MKKILLTGFEPFDRDSTNPSGEWIHWQLNKKYLDDRLVKGIILPVTFHGAFAAYKNIYDKFLPDIVVHTGLAKNRTHLTVERIGINWVDARIPDNDGVVISKQKISSKGPDGIFTTVDLIGIEKAALESGVELKVSTSAGEYVCNELLYRSLCYTEESNHLTRITFIHLPGADNYENIYQALNKVVAAL